MVGQIAEVLQLHFNSSHPVHDVSNPTACLWGLVMALVSQIQDGPVIDLNPRGTVPCPRCFSTEETLHPFGVSFRKETKPCTWYGGEAHVITTCPLIRASVLQACKNGLPKDLRRVQQDLQTHRAHIHPMLHDPLQEHLPRERQAV